MTADARDYARWALLRDYQAVEPSVEVVRVKRDGDDAVVAARFEDQSGRPRRAMVGFVSVDGAWRGTGGFSEAAQSTGDAHPAWHSGFWSHSGGRRLVSGFWVAEPTAVSLRVTDVAGRVLADTVEGGVAVVVGSGDFDVSRATVELLDADDGVIVAGPVWPAPGLGSG